MTRIVCEDVVPAAPRCCIPAPEVSVQGLSRVPALLFLECARGPSPVGTGGQRLGLEQVRRPLVPLARPAAVCLEPPAAPGRPAGGHQVVSLGRNWHFPSDSGWRAPCHTLLGCFFILPLHAFFLLWNCRSSVFWVETLIGYVMENSLSSLWLDFS